MKDAQISDNMIIDNSLSFAQNHCKKFDVKFRKNKGQFFTPKNVAKFMADNIKLDKKNIRILDPGAGTGILIAAVCDRIASEKTHSSSIIIDAYENDKNLIPFLKDTLTLCQKKLLQNGHQLKYNISNSNFIIDNDYSIFQKRLISTKKEIKIYDLVIANPPYYKLKIQSPESLLLKDFVFGQPNIYSLFMIMAMQLIKDNGSFVFIIPRSFCSGLYYRKIRNWFVKNTQIKIIHCFESRLKIFEDNVHQEIVILIGIKTNADQNKSTKISISYDKTFKKSFSFFAQNQIIFEQKSPESFIRIPQSENDLKIIQEIDSYNNSLKSLGLEISTGKVVDFRTRENLIFNSEDTNWVPLLWMHNLKEGVIEWPSKTYTKPQGILLNNKTKKQLIPVDNYILLKRFTSKCQKRRLYAIPLFKKDFRQFSLIGLENHLNYIYGVDKSISDTDLMGITALLNTSFYDIYFRTISGNTQVNATDMRTIPLPSIKKIREIGKNAKNQKFQPSRKMDLLIGRILNVNELVV